VSEKNEAQEKTEEPTARRKQQSREKGEVARSRELNILASMLLAGLGFLFIGGTMATQVARLMSDSLRFDSVAVFDKSAVIEQFGSAIVDALLILTPFGLLSILVALVGPMMMGGIRFTWSSIAPKFEKLNPITGLGRIFSLKSLVELGKSVIKVIMIGGCAYAFFVLFMDDILTLWQLQTDLAIVSSNKMLIWELLFLCIAMIVVVGVDVPFQIWDHNKKLKMSLQEVKDEMKETEGRPEVKSKIRQLQRDITQNRMMADVPQASVVITNPSHFAVAISYDMEYGATPIVVAKGQDLIAAQIRLIAKEHDVMICELPPLARALYWNVDVGAEIPHNLYLAVAKVLAYVFHLNRSYAENTQKVPFPSDIQIPDEYKADIERS